MDFFKSVFAAPPDPAPGAEEEEEEQEDEEAAEVVLREDAEVEDSRGEVRGGSAWGGFSGLIKTLATKSESVIETYRRDLEEFGSGLRRETEAIRDVVKELPSSLETGVSFAQESLESVGQAIDDFGGSVWRGTNDIIAQGKDALLSTDPEDSGDATYSPRGSSTQGGVGASRPYSRFEAKVLGIQSDPATFSEEPEDVEDFASWISEFRLAEKAAEVGDLLAESRALESNLAILVPQIVDYQTFWSRYFYKVYKLKQAEDMRANLVKRVISREEDEDLSWEVDDEDTFEKDSKKEHEQVAKKQEFGQGQTGVSVQDNNVADKTASGYPSTEKSVADVAAIASPLAAGEDVSSQIKDGVSVLNTREVNTKVDEKMLLELKGEVTESCKDSDVSIVSSQPSMPEEDDLGWEEIEDLGDSDEKIVEISTASPSKIELRKKSSAAEEEEDLSWDVEDDEPHESLI